MLRAALHILAGSGFVHNHCSVGTAFLHTDNAPLFRACLRHAGGNAKRSSAFGGRATALLMPIWPIAPSFSAPTRARGHRRDEARSGDTIRRHGPATRPGAGLRRACVCLRCCAGSRAAALHASTFAPTLPFRCASSPIALALRGGAVTARSKFRSSATTCSASCRTMRINAKSKQ